MNDGSRLGKELHRLIDDALDESGRRSLVAVRALREHLVWLEQRAVMRARADGLSWGKVGRLLGRTPQAVRQRHRVLPPIPTPQLPLSRDAAFMATLERAKRESRWAEEDPVAW